VRSPSDDFGFRSPLSLAEERSTDLRRLLQDSNDDLMTEFRERLLISWVYHDNALEGTVLSHHELNCAIDQEIVSDVSLIPTYDEIRAHRAAIDLVYELAAKKRSPVSLDTIKKVYATLNPTVGDVKLVRYRKETPLHRLYFHEISPPEKISYRMRRLVEWLASPQARNMNPIKLSAKLHFRLMHIYPFPKGSGKMARLVMNLVLLRHGYQPAIIHATDRQRYYDALRIQHSGLTRLICESLLNSVEGGIKYLEEQGYDRDLKVASAR
jgi:Fic family protein